MIYLQKKGAANDKSQFFGLSRTLLTIALCVAGGVSSHADHPTQQAISNERYSTALTKAPHTPTFPAGREFYCLDQTRIKPFEDPKTKAVVLIFISPDDCKAMYYSASLIALYSTNSASTSANDASKLAF